MKNLYRATLKFNVALDSFILFPSNDPNELLILSHYINKILTLRSGKYVSSKEGIIFIPDVFNNLSNVFVKELKNTEFKITSDILLENKETTVLQYAFCENESQLFIACSPIDKKNRDVSSIGDSPYFKGYKPNLEDTTVFKPFEF